MAPYLSCMTGIYFIPLISFCIICCVTGKNIRLFTDKNYNFVTAVKKKTHAQLVSSVIGFNALKSFKVELLHRIFSLSIYVFKATETIIHWLTSRKGVHQFRFFLSTMRTPNSIVVCSCMYAFLLSRQQ